LPAAFWYKVQDLRTTGFIPEVESVYNEGAMADPTSDPVFKRFGDVVAVNKVNNEILGQFICGDDPCVGHLDPCTSMYPGGKTEIAFTMANAHIFSSEGDTRPWPDPCPIYLIPPLLGLPTLGV
jgi:hypothetical protein